MSVATSTRTVPSLKPASARVRAPWLLLPWIAAASMPSFVQLLGEAVGAVLHAREHQHLLPVAGDDQVAQQFALAALVDRVDQLR